MDLYQIIKTRRSVRQYKSKPVPEEKLTKILQAGQLAPSTHNSQAWKFVVVQDKEKRKKLVKAAHNQAFVGQAPVVIVAVALDPDHVMVCQVPAYAVDLAIAVDHMTLAAAAESLGTCWIGSFDQDQVREILSIPQQYKVVALLPLGFPADKPGLKIRKEFEEIVCYNSFSE